MQVLLERQKWIKKLQKPCLHFIWKDAAFRSLFIQNTKYPLVLVKHPKDQKSQKLNLYTLGSLFLHTSWFIYSIIIETTCVLGPRITTVSKAESWPSLGLHFRDGVPCRSSSCHCSQIASVLIFLPPPGYWIGAGCLASYTIRLNPSTQCYCEDQMRQ